MSSFACAACGAIHHDTPRGYVTSCKHFTDRCDVCGEKMAEWNNGLACPRCFLELEAGDEPGK
jgi:hypothetical protein